MHHRSSGRLNDGAAVFYTRLRDAEVSEIDSDSGGTDKLDELGVDIHYRVRRFCRGRNISRTNSHRDTSLTAQERARV